MLKRTKIRRRLMAVLCSTDIPQGLTAEGECLKGPLWENCPDAEGEAEPISVFDTSTQQVISDFEDKYEDGHPEQSVVNFRVPRVNYTFTRKKIDKTRITFMIEVITYGPDGYERQNTLDEIEKRIFHRLLSQAPITDAETGENLMPIMKMARQNALTVETGDDASPLEDHTLREFTFTLDTDECMPDLNCEITPLCFDFSKLTKLEKEDQND